MGSHDNGCLPAQKKLKGAAKGWVLNSNPSIQCTSFHQLLMFENAMKEKLRLWTKNFEFAAVISWMRQVCLLHGSQVLQDRKGENQTVSFRAEEPEQEVCLCESMAQNLKYNQGEQVFIPHLPFVRNKTYM